MNTASKVKPHTFKLARNRSSDNYESSQTND